MMTTSNSTFMKTALYNQHKACGAKVIEFGGWLMPVSYTSVLTEHKAVREKCGIFDVSHMGEVTIKGPQAEAFVQHITMNDAAKLKPGQGQYSALLNESGGMIDDLIVYRLGAEEFFICMNAANRTKDFQWISTHATDFDVRATNESDQWAQLAVQGPTSLDAMMAVVEASDRGIIEALPYTNIAKVNVAGRPCLVARTGYTGEHGYEIYLPVDHAEKLWLALLATAPKTGIVPVGLGARDTLRLEACYLLYGNDMNDETTPLEAGVAWAVKLTKPAFIGKDALVRQKASGIKQKIVALKMKDDGIPRHGMTVYWRGEPAGFVTSGSVLPTVGGAGGMAMVSAGVVENDELEVDIRGKRKLATVVKRPLYSAKTK
jgi:aminomethyltransferase